MVLYIVSIVGANVFMILLSIFHNVYNLPLWQILVASIGGTIGVIAIDGFFAFFVNKLPEKWFDHNVKIHFVKKGECKFYDFLGIKLWKDHVLELGFLADFSKKTIAEPNNKKYIETFISECNYGIWVHICDIVFGWLLYLFYPQNLYVYFPLTICVVNSILNLLPTMILRYNVPRLHRMRNLLEKKEARAAKKQEALEEVSNL